MPFDAQRLLDEIRDDAVAAYNTYVAVSGIASLKSDCGAMPETFLQSHFLCSAGVRYPIALECNVPGKRFDLVVLNGRGSVAKDTIAAVVEYKRLDDYREVRNVEAQAIDAMLNFGTRGAWVVTANITHVENPEDRDWYTKELLRLKGQGYLVSSAIGVTPAGNDHLCAYVIAKRV